MKPYKNCMICGRFQILHKGHGKLIEIASRLAEKVYILIGSSQAGMTWKNPFYGHERYDILYSYVLKNIKDHENIHIHPIVDMRENIVNDAAWGYYLKDQINEKERKNVDIDLVIFGQEQEKQDWKLEEVYPGVTILAVQKDEMSSSNLKEQLFENMDMVRESLLDESHMNQILERFRDITRV